MREIFKKNVNRVYIASTNSIRSLQDVLEAVNVGFESTLLPPCSDLPKEHVTLRKEKKSVVTYSSFILIHMFSLVT